MLGGRFLESVRRGLARQVLEGLVGYVAYSLGHGAERGRRLDPSHGAGQRDSDELRLSGIFRQDEPQSEAVQGFEEEAIEDILDVCFGRADWSISGICVPDDGEEPV